MGQSRGGGYDKLPTLSPEQQSLLSGIIGPASGNINQAAQGFSQFLPGGGGGQAITEQANKNFQQRTLPSIINSFGSGAKSSSALNQALAAGASNLNTDLAAQLSQMQLQAASGLGQLGQNQASLGLGTPTFAYQQQGPNFWQQILGQALGIGGSALGSYLGAPKTNLNLGQTQG